MSKVLKESWRRARADWEATPERTYAEVARDLAVAVPTVYARARRENWTKMFEPQDLAAHAHLRVNAAERVLERNNTELVEEVSTVLDLSVETRVRTINRARDDWTEHRRLFPQEVCASDPAAAKRAKLTAEMLVLRQRGEFVAYGLVEFTGRTTDAPLVEQVEDAAQPKAPWELLLESYITTGKSPAWSHESGHTPQQEVDPNAEDPFADDPPRVRLLPGIPPELDEPDTPPSQH